MKKHALKILIALSIPITSFGQMNLETFLNSGLNDVNQLGEAYLEPYGKGFGTAMNGGWYNTARPHKLFGFDLTINATMVTIPTADKTFDLADYEWESITYTPGNSVTSTVAGGEEGAPVGLLVTDGSNEVELNNLYTLPTGTNFGYTPLPMVQFGIGLPKGTNIQLRLFPNYEFGDFGEVSMFGFGLRHDIKQWIPVVKKLPFDLSIQGAWSKLSAAYTNIDYFPTDYLTFDEVEPGLQNLSPAEKESKYFSGQELALTTTAWNANIIVSKKLLFVTVYGSLGYASSEFNVGLNGTYLIPEYEIDPSEPDGVRSILAESNKEKDPIDMSMGYSTINTSIGLRVNIAVVTLHGAFVYQDYSMFNFGIGISIR